MSDAEEGIVQLYMRSAQTHATFYNSSRSHEDFDDSSRPVRFSSRSDDLIRGGRWRIDGCFSGVVKRKTVPKRDAPRMTVVCMYVYIYSHGRCLRYIYRASLRSAVMSTRPPLMTSASVDRWRTFRLRGRKQGKTGRRTLFIYFWNHRSGERKSEVSITDSWRRRKEKREVVQFNGTSVNQLLIGSRRLKRK